MREDDTGKSGKWAIESLGKLFRFYSSIHLSILWLFSIGRRVAYSCSKDDYAVLKAWQQIQRHLMDTKVSHGC